MYTNILEMILSTTLLLILIAFVIMTALHIILIKNKKINMELQELLDFSDTALTPKKNSRFFSVSKRMQDIIFSLLSIVIISPIIVVICIAIKMYDNGPIYIKQKLIGKNCKIIEKYKFRTTIMEISPQGKLITKLTPVGAIIKSLALDMLPIFYNILIGTMTTVGLNNYQCLHDNDYLDLPEIKYLFDSCKPGLLNITVYLLTCIT